MLLVDMKEENDSLTCAVIFAIKLKNVKEENGLDKSKDLS